MSSSIIDMTGDPASDDAALGDNSESESDADLLDDDDGRDREDPEEDCREIQGEDSARPRAEEDQASASFWSGFLAKSRRAQLSHLPIIRPQKRIRALGTTQAPSTEAKKLAGEKKEKHAGRYRGGTNLFAAGFTRTTSIGKSPAIASTSRQSPSEASLPSAPVPVPAELAVPKRSHKKKVVYELVSESEGGKSGA